MENYIGIRVWTNRIGYGTVVSCDETWLRALLDKDGQIRTWSVDSLKSGRLKVVSSSDEEERVEKSKEELFNTKISLPSKAVVPDKAKEFIRKLDTDIWRNSSSVQDFLEFYVEELDKEIVAAESDDTNRKDLYDGVFVTKSRSSSIYRFESIDALSLPVNFGLYIKMDENFRCKGEVLEKDEEGILLAIEGDHGDSIEHATVYSDTTFLLEKLKDRLREQVPLSDLAKKLILEIRERKTAGRITELGQERAIEMADSEDILFIWGPPGTGKTHVLSRIAENLLDSNKRTLIVSNNNIAVDNAIVRVGRNQKYSTGTVLRFGYPVDPEVRKSELNSFTLVLNENPEIASRREEFLSDLRSGTLNEEETEYVRGELKSIRAELKELERMKVKKARLVGTTLSKASTDGSVYRGKFDAVILDEASTALIPAVVFAASLSTSQIFIVGDFCQLGTIAVAKEVKGLKHDIFDYSGISDQIQNGDSHRNLVMLDTQYRMHRDIANIVSDRMYAGLLKTHESVMRAGSVPLECVRQAPFRGQAVIRIDTGKAGFYSRQIRSWRSASHYNLYSACLSVMLADSCQGDCAVVTPFRKQAYLIRSLLKSVNKRRKQEKGLPPIECATVHSFQGSEKATVILDLVQTRGNLSFIFQNDGMRKSDRLINVAVTRAKGKLIVLGDSSYFGDQSIQGTLLSDLLNHIPETNEDIFGQTASLAIEEISFPSASERKKKFAEDLQNTRKSIICSIGSESRSAKGKRELIESAAEKQNIKERIQAGSGTRSMLSGFEKRNGVTDFAYVILDRRTVWVGYPFSDSNTTNIHESWETIRICSRSFTKEFIRYVNLKKPKETTDEDSSED